MMRVVPALFVGRRSLVLAEKICTPMDAQDGYRCGACSSVILSAERADIMDVVVKCQCGEYNQI
jgi:DNA-directed RNA polymerase subunit RPC12/RpoP